ncbi:hypothetical protein [Pyrobaculum sp.]|uniref:hypothetical protein n=1 Tax=Pyrobaculum sp. TaxID=2004705 RepID=UPI003D14A6C5
MNTEPKTQTIPSESQNQTTEQIKLEILKPVRNLEIHNVSRQVYNTLRSFVESSDKSTYPWNVGIWINSDTVVFEKRNKWKLYVYPHYGYFKLYNWRGDLVVDGSRKENDRLMIYINTHNGGDISVDAYSDDLYFIAITSDVPFARPIRLLEIIEKLCEYARFPFC